jgi:hypothetical protein
MCLTRSFRKGLRHFAYASVVAGFLTPAIAVVAPLSSTASAQSSAAVGAQDVRVILSKYGAFQPHERYGEVWVPNTVPQGWHPYPACNWTHTRQFGWYFDDKSPWGQIVHHYGRWTNDAALGWVWVAGAEFSPGWVVWRSGDQYTGWAPTPPDADVGKINSDEFNAGSQWTFMETRKLRAGCSPTAIVPGPQIPLVLRETRFVTDIEYVDGIAEVVLPTWVQLPYVNVNTWFQPWPAGFFAQTIMHWNWFWTTLNVTVNITNPCGH